VRVHDFLVEDLGRVVPYGVYDLAANAGWVSVRMYYDTSVSLRRGPRTLSRFINGPIRIPFWLSAF